MSDGRITLPELLVLVRRNFIIIIVILLAGMTVGVAYTGLKSPIYTASSAVIVSVQEASDVQDLTFGNNFVQQVVASYAEVATEPIVLNRVINKLRLSESFSDLERRVTASAPLDTSVINIEANDSSPTQAAGLANAVAQELQSAVNEISPPRNGSSSPIRITIIRPATVPDRPSSPNLVVDIGLGLLVAVLLSAVVVASRHALRSRITTAEELEAVAGTPSLGSIPFVSEIQKNPLHPTSAPSSRAGESIRTIRASLQFVDVDTDRKVIVVTSAQPGEGKSTSLVNIAIALARAGERTLVIDADLRRPRLASYFGVEGTVGLADALAGAADIGAVIQKWGEHNLSLIPAGAAVPNPSELLQSNRMSALIAGLSEYTYILIDAPPVLAVADALILGRQADGVLLIVSTRKTRQAAVSASVHRLRQASCKILGGVLTLATGPTATRYGYDYGYGYGGDTPTDKMSTATVDSPELNA